MGRSWGLCGRSWAALGSSVGGLGLLLRPPMGCPGRPVWPLWMVFGCSWPKRGPGCSGSAIWERDQARKMALASARKRSGWRSWAVPGAYVGALGSLLGPMSAVLSCSWDFCWRSWRPDRAEDMSKPPTYPSRPTRFLMNAYTCIFSCICTHV